MSTLADLALEHFPDLTAVEKRVLVDVTNGLVIDLSDGDENRRNPLKAEEQWRDQQLLRARFLQWLLTEPQVLEARPLAGVDLLYAIVDGDLNIDHAKTTHLIGVRYSRLGHVTMRYGEFGFVSFAGSIVEDLDATGCRVMSDFRLNEGFESHGPILLQGIEVERDLNCSGAKVKSGSGSALIADFCRVKGSVRMGSGFTASGPVGLFRSRIDGDLDCSGGRFSASATQAGAEIAPARLEHALALDGAKIGGGVLFRDGFHAEGEVRLLGAEIKGQLSCRGGTFREAGSGHALTAEGAQITGTLFLASAESDKTQTTFEGSVHLASCSALAVSFNRNTLAEGGRGEFDGFRYQKLAFLDAQLVPQPLEREVCKQWLQFATRMRFARQPYSQLVAVLRASGEDELADEMMIAMHRTRRAHLHGWDFAKSYLFDGLLGFGYRPRYCLYWLLLLLSLGVPAFAVARHQGFIVERPSPVSVAIVQGRVVATPVRLGSGKDGSFNPAIYALEVLVPLPDLGQKRRWEIRPGGGAGEYLVQGWYYLCIILGPLLSTLFSVGLTGLVRKT
jgi:hypothetical protein